MNSHKREIQGVVVKRSGDKTVSILVTRKVLHPKYHKTVKRFKKYLVHDTHSPHLTTQGYGWARPIDTNDTEEGRSNNRRVQLEVNGSQSK